MFSAYRSARFYPLSLSVIAGILLGLAWFEYFNVVVFIGLVLIIELEVVVHGSKRSGLKFFGYALLSMFLWNSIAIWWLWNASGYVTLAAWGLNAFFMTWPLLAYRWIKSATAHHFGGLALIACWLAFEYLHLHWDFSWIWLFLGHCFNTTPQWVQWYEYTGVFGGTVWVLVVAILAHRLVFEGKRNLVVVLTVLTVPLLISQILWYSYNDTGTPVEVAVIQPNIDCYFEKFEYNVKTGLPNERYIPYQHQVDTFLSLVRQAVRSQTRFVLLPESSLHQVIDETSPLSDPAVQRFEHFLTNHPGLSLLIGADCYRFFPKDAVPQRATIRITQDGYPYEIYNAGLFLADTIGVYHKSKLVVGVETIPFASVLKPLLLNFGGTTGGVGKSEVGPVVFVNGQNQSLAPVICYESVYGQYVNEFITKGAQFIGVITNDGWWGNTPGHRQHLDFSRLRAIETRRYVARSANTGVSCFINARGEILQSLPYGQAGFLTSTVKLRKELTFYVRHGDYLARTGAFLAGLFLVAALSRSILRAKTNRPI